MSKDFSFINGILKVKSALLLEKKEYLLLSKTPKTDFFQVLGNFWNQELSLETVEDVIKGEYLTIKEEILSLIPSDIYGKVFFRDFDINNIRLLYKSKIFNVNVDKYLSNMGIMAINSLKEAILKENYQDFDNEMRDLFYSINDLIKDNYSLSSSIVAKKYYEYLFSVLKLNKDLNLTDFLQEYVTILNFITIIRAKRLNLSKAELLFELVANGKKDPSELLRIYDYSIQDLYQNLDFNSDEELSTPKLSLIKEQYLLKFISDFKFTSDDSRFLIYYVTSKMLELKKVLRIYYDEFTDLEY